ncbi:MAG: SLBB domain-containing protein [Rhodothermales bacterium]
MFLVPSGPAQAQGFPSGYTNPGALQQIRQRSFVSEGATTPLEGALDPDVYVIGPGDVFNVTVGGPEPILVTAVVTADGYLVLPESESVEVAGLSLAAAREQIRTSLRQQFQNVGLDVALAQPRQFRVHVSGAVPVAGRYTATPNARVNDVIQLAFADTSQPAVTNVDYQPSLRDVTLRRQDGTRQSLDLLRYFATGDVDQNPYLQDGDVLFVNAFDPNYQAVFIDGAVPFPGTYAYRSDDTILGLLTLATGDTSVDSTVLVRLTRRGASEVEDQEVSVASLLAGADVRVEPLDHLYVIPERRLGGTATILGAVRYPGTYPITLGQTTLQDLTQMAGGPREDALERAALLQRRPEAGSPLTSGGVARFRQTGASAQADAASVLRRTRLAELEFTSRAYFAQELSQPGGVPIDLGAVMAAEGEPVYLQDGDVLLVPRDEQTVLVLGQVVRPGYAAFEPGRAGEQYIQEAGGRGPEAAKAYLVKAGTGRFLPLGQGAVESGDIIFVDRREGVADTAELQRLLLETRRTRADARSRVAQIVFSAIATTATIITTYLVVRDRQ